MKKFLATVAAIATAVVTITPARADGNSLADHKYLWEAIQSVGVTTVINSPRYCSGDASGIYDSGRAIMAICQDNARAFGHEVAWTQNDLDTLRHEAHHLIQDCNVGRIGDAQMGRMFSSGDDLEAFVRGALTNRQIKGIAEVYRANGANNRVVLIELEAFAVAESVSAERIADKVLDWCGDL